MTEAIDFSRYRVAKAIVDRYEAGESAAEIAADFFDVATPGVVDGVRMSIAPTYVVQLIVAAHDRSGKYEPKASA